MIVPPIPGYRVLAKPSPRFEGNALLRASAVIAMLACLGIGPASAEVEIRLRPGLRIWGASVDFGLRLNPDPEQPDGLSPAAVTPRRLGPTIWLRASGAWGDSAYYRHVDGSLVTSTAPAAQSLVFNRANANWGVGLEVPLVDDSTWSTTLWYLGAYDYRFFEDGSPTLLSLTAFADRQQSLVNSVDWSVRYTTLRATAYGRSISGIYAALGVQWAPNVAAPDAQLGRSAFLRPHLISSFFLPVIEPAAEDPAGFGSYLALNVMADAIVGLDPSVLGNGIPVTVRRTLGAVYSRDGLGGSVRGYETGRFDGEIKLVANAELRFTFRQLLADLIVPGFLLFFDAGLVASDRSWAVGDGDGWETTFLASTGVGITLGVVGVTTLAAYTHVLVGELPRINGARFVPFGLGFSLHF